MRDLIAELKSLNADWRALRDAAESLDCGAPDVWTMLMIELRAARSDTPKTGNQVKFEVVNFNGAGSLQ